MKTILNVVQKKKCFAETETYKINFFIQYLFNFKLLEKQCLLIICLYLFMFSLFLWKTFMAQQNYFQKKISIGN